MGTASPTSSHPAPPELGPATATLPFGAGGLRMLRHTVRALATSLDPDRVDDLVLAISELASNSIEHGHGHGLVRMWQRPHTIVAEVVDEGGTTSPLPDPCLPPIDGERGRGLWLASELCDVFEVWCRPDRTTVRVEMAHPR